MTSLNSTPHMRFNCPHHGMSDGVGFCIECAKFPDGFGRSGKQPRYQDARGDDWIDEFARTATPEEFRGAMRFTLGKYNRRMGKKDDVPAEIEKMRDYCERWLEVERSR